ncbi:hypothetical protein E2C01_068008 [Portunus trituberculatus]|uniref:Uncharacterized protein n=1 Tax=Portunus trituberculatus TaxID=210409 RepID=A0A5B7HUN3_PORTR|nr:hypothetical protein [Portunus trituberculatus]
MVADVMATPVCENNMPTAQLRQLPLVQKPVEELITKVSDQKLADQVFDCIAVEGTDCNLCKQGEVGQVVALMPVMLIDCQRGNLNVCPKELQEKANAVIQKMGDIYKSRRTAILERFF